MSAPNSEGTADELVRMLDAVTAYKREPRSPGPYTMATLLAHAEVDAIEAGRPMNVVPFVPRPRTGTHMQEE